MERTFRAHLELRQLNVNAACVAVAPTDAVENLSERDIIRATAEVVSAAALADGRPEDRDLLARCGAGGGVAALLPVHDLVLRRDVNLERGLLRDELAVADHLAAAPLDIDAPRKCSLKIDVAVTRVAAAECAGADAGDEVVLVGSGSQRLQHRGRGTARRRASGRCALAVGAHGRGSSERVGAAASSSLDASPKEAGLRALESRRTTGGAVGVVDDVGRAVA